LPFNHIIGDLSSFEGLGSFILIATCFSQKECFLVGFWRALWHVIIALFFFAIFIFMSIFIALISQLICGYIIDFLHFIDEGNFFVS
jgi:hypothetical protein